MICGSGGFFSLWKSTENTNFVFKFPIIEERASFSFAFALQSLSHKFR